MRWVLSIALIFEIVNVANADPNRELCSELGFDRGTPLYEICLERGADVAIRENGRVDTKNSVVSNGETLAPSLNSSIEEARARDREKVKINRMREQKIWSCIAEEERRAEDRHARQNQYKTTADCWKHDDPRVCYERNSSDRYSTSIHLTPAVKNDVRRKCELRHPNESTVPFSLGNGQSRR